jgi:outer membrane protein assembly factor BamB
MNSEEAILDAGAPSQQANQSTEGNNKSKPRKPLRLWPGITLAILVLLTIFIAPIFIPQMGGAGVFFGALGGVLIVLWWLLFSRARWIERLGAVVLMVITMILTKRVVHPSIAGGGMGFLIYVFAIPAMTIGLVAAATISRNFSTTARRVLIAAAIVLACGAFTLMRTGGITGDADSDIHWRWSKTPEERLLLMQANEEPVTTPASGAPVPLGDSSSSWPGFRGANRDGIIHGVRIDTDWAQKPPVEMWRRPVGPAWSSFAVQDNFVYTQEQRGEDELVSCYELNTGKPVWRHRDAARFYESNAGAGPRGTPTLSNGRVYTFGGTGILNALDARNGSLIWSRNVATETKTKTPGWGFSSSPLVVGDQVIVAAASSLASYDAATGNPRWTGATNPKGYSSPHLATIGGVTQIVLLNGDGVIGVAPADGKILWQHAWSSDGIVQPAFTADGDMLLGSGSGMGEVGFRRIGITQGANGWTTAERWTSEFFNPYFSDFVVHKEYAYGFEGSSIACIDLKNKGESKWKGGKFGHGQLVLLADQDLLLVISEAGELALVKATPDQFTEVARFKAIEGKTWNHPVLVKDVVLVRNDQEMAAFRLSLAKS